MNPSERKRGYGTIVLRSGFSTAFAIVLLVVAVLPAAAGPQAEVTVLPDRTIAADGSATTEIDPDSALVTFGIVVVGADTNQTVVSNEASQRRLVGALEGAGVPAGEIATTRYVMSYVVDTFIPALGTQQHVEFDVQQKGAYHVTSKVAVLVAKLNDLDAIIQAGVNGGADRVDSIEYRSARVSETQQELLPKAVAVAHSRAVALASAAGVALGELERLSVIGPGPWGGGSESATPAARFAAGTLTGSNAEGGIAPAKIVVSLRVRADYRITKAGG